jgi:proteasome beta subunit
MDEDFKKSVLKTGTSIVGIVCKDGVIMAGDRQVTLGGSIIIGKNFRKVEKLNNYLVVSSTGMVSDAQVQSKIINAQLRLKELKTKQRPTVRESASLIAMNTFQNIRQPSMIPSIVGMLVAGFNEDGTTELYTVDMSGGIYKVEDYDANFGSGMPYMLGLLERIYKKNINVEDGVKLAVECIKSSTQRDTGSGFGIDVFTITKEGIKQVVEQDIEPNFKDSKK